LEWRDGRLSTSSRWQPAMTKLLIFRTHLMLRTKLWYGLKPCHSLLNRMPQTRTLWTRHWLYRQTLITLPLFLLLQFLQQFFSGSQFLFLYRLGTFYWFLYFFRHWQFSICNLQFVFQPFLFLLLNHLFLLLRHLKLFVLLCVFLL